MRFNTLILSMLCALASAQEVKRQQSSLDIAAAHSQASLLASLVGSAYPSATAAYTVPFQTPGGNLLQPPASLVGAIITGVPASVLVQVWGSAGKSSLASEFKAGNTPAWYQSLPEGVKSYISALASQIGHNEVDLSATPSGNGFGVANLTPTGQVAQETATGADAKVTSSKSKGAAAAQATPGPLKWSAGAALGILGIALAL